MPERHMWHIDFYDTDSEREIHRFVIVKIVIFVEIIEFGRDAGIIRIWRWFARSVHYLGPKVTRLVPTTEPSSGDRVLGMKSKRTVMLIGALL